MSNLKPCPFCGSNDIEESCNEVLHFSYECNQCGSRGSFSDKYRTTEKEINDGSDPWFGEGITVEEASEQAAELWNRRASPWIRVEDRLPEEGEFVAVKFDGSDYWKKAEYCGCNSWFDDKEWPVKNITHWMPIPEVERQ